MVFEDVHWSDPTTQESLDLLIDRVPTLPVLVIVTFRPEFRAALDRPSARDNAYSQSLGAAAARGEGREARRCDQGVAATSYGAAGPGHIAAS